MGSANKFGICKLCLSSAELKKSHFLPKAAYRILKKAAGDSPIAVSAAKSVLIERQIDDYVLCSRCEDRFNSNGERWVMNNCQREDGRFKLREKIESAEPLIVSGGMGCYSATAISDIDIEKLAYFAASIFWRGAAHRWQSATGPIEQLKISSKQREDLRLFLIGEAPFPRHAVLFVSIIQSPDLSVILTLPLGGRDNANQIGNFYFSFLGISFNLLLGNQLKPSVRRFCAYRAPEKFIFYGPDAGRNLLQLLMPSITKTSPVGRLKEIY